MPDEVLVPWINWSNLWDKQWKTYVANDVDNLRFAVVMSVSKDSTGFGTAMTANQDEERKSAVIFMSIKYHSILHKTHASLTRWSKDKDFTRRFAKICPDLRVREKGQLPTHKIFFFLLCI